MILSYSIKSSRKVKTLCGFIILTPNTKSIDVILFIAVLPQYLTILYLKILFTLSLSSLISYILQKRYLSKTRSKTEIEIDNDDFLMEEILYYYRKNQKIFYNG